MITFLRDSTYFIQNNPIAKDFLVTYSRKLGRKPIDHNGLKALFPAESI